MVGVPEAVAAAAGADLYRKGKAPLKRPLKNWKPLEEAYAVEKSRSMREG